MLQEVSEDFQKTLQMFGASKVISESVLSESSASGGYKRF